MREATTMTPNSLPVLIMCGISCYAGLSRLVMYVLRMESRVNLYFAFVCFSIAFYDAMAVGLYNCSSVEAGVLWQRGQFFASNFIGGSAFLMVFALYEKKSVAFKILYICLLAAFLALGLAFPGLIVSASRPNVRSFAIFGGLVTYFEGVTGILFNLTNVLLVVGMAYILRIAISAARSRKREDAYFLLVGLSLFFASAFTDILIASNIILSLYSAEYVFFALILMMDLAVQKRFVSLFREVEALNVGLEARVERRTQEITGLVSQLYSKNAELQDKNAVLAELADRDGLTKLLNHAAFHRRLAEEFSASRRQLFCLSLVMIDIDRFKEINDTYGHQAGDKVILMVAEVLMHNSRDYDLKSRLVDDPAASQAAEAGPAIRLYDVSGRYGGDEFALLLPYCGAKDVLVIAERVRARIEAIAVPGLPDLRVGASLGCAVYDPRAKADCPVADLMQAADRALYEAKAAGRGRTAVSSA